MKFPYATLTNLVAPISDHNPILLDMEPSIRQHLQRTFKFENRWLFEELKTVVGRSWYGFRDLSFISRIKALGETLTLWGNIADSHLRARKRELEKQIFHLQGSHTQASHVEYISAKEELDRLIFHEETFWLQRAKDFWLRDGDMNTKFFH